MEPTASTLYPPMTPQALAEELGVSLSQRLQPRLDQEVPKRFISQEEAEARGLSWRFTGSDVCRYGHNAARRSSNSGICSDCERVKEGKEPIYGKSKTQKYYTEPRRKATDPSAPVVIAAPIAQPAQIEPSKKEQDFLAALDETRDFDAAAQRTTFSRSQIEARASVNEVFRKALTDLCERRGIARTRAPDSLFTWSEEVEKNLVRRFVDTGLLETARNECGVTASEFFIHLERSPTFAAAVEAARPRARETLRDRAVQSAERGNANLMKLMEDSEPESVTNLSMGQINAEITKLLQHFDKQGLLVGDFEPRYYQHRETGQRINLRDFYKVQPDSSNLDLVSSL